MAALPSRQNCIKRGYEAAVSAQEAVFSAFCVSWESISRSLLRENKLLENEKRPAAEAAGRSDAVMRRATYRESM